MTVNAAATMAIACLVLLFGYGLRARIGLLDRLNLPAPVIGGLVASVTVLAIRLSGLPPIKFDTVLQTPLMIAFFTTIGFTASVRLLKRGGPRVVLLLAIAAVVAIAQALVGAGVAKAFGLPALTGVLAGTATLSGGPATGLAFAPQFEAAGVTGAAALATATAMAGILMAGLFGAPLATLLIERRGLDPRNTMGRAAEGSVAIESPAAPVANPSELTFAVLKTVTVIAVSMWLGGLVSGLIQAWGITLPAYIGSMLVAAVFRNLDDLTGVVKLPHEAIEVGGGAVLALFLVLAMMSLDLSLLSGLAAPLLVNLAVQLALIAALVLWPVWWLMGRDYEAAVTAGGFAGFMLGITANAMAIMRSLVEKYAEAPRAFLVVPLVGAFFIDFVNALVITLFLNLWG